MPCWHFKEKQRDYATLDKLTNLPQIYCAIKEKSFALEFVLMKTLRYEQLTYQIQLEYCHTFD